VNPLDRPGCCHCGDALNKDDRRWCGRDTVTCRDCAFDFSGSLAQAKRASAWRRVRTLRLRLPVTMTLEEAHCDG